MSTYTTGNTTRELVSVSTGSQGTPPIINSGLILLATSNNATETFQYVVKLTGYDASLATNTITLSVTNAVGYARSITSSGNAVTISFAGVPGFQYVVERSSSVTDWSAATIVQTKTVPETGVWTFSETPPGNPAFYRLRQNNSL